VEVAESNCSDYCKTFGEKKSSV